MSFVITAPETVSTTAGSLTPHRRFPGGSHSRSGWSHDKHRGCRQR